MPASRIATMSSVVATGRRMNGRDGFMAVPRAADESAARVLLSLLAAARRSAVARPAFGSASRGRRLRVARNELDRSTFAELVGAVDDDHRPRRDPARDRRCLAL